MKLFCMRVLMLQMGGISLVPHLGFWQRLGLPRPIIKLMRWFRRGKEEGRARREGDGSRNRGTSTTRSGKTGSLCSPPMGMMHF